MMHTFQVHGLWVRCFHVSCLRPEALCDVGSGAALHELRVLQHIVWPSVAHTSQQLNPWCCLGVCGWQK